jgi:hypothetical protein
LILHNATNVLDDTYRFLSYLDLATNRREIVIVNFARELLLIAASGFEKRGSVLPTQGLSDAVIADQWPEVETEVLTLVGPNRPLREGMETPEYRRVAFLRLIAFKALAKSQWEKFLVD